MTEDEKEGVSIVYPHLVTVKTDSKGSETLIPYHFFQKESTISIGVGSWEPKPDVILNKKDNTGPSMAQFGLSNRAFSIKFEVGSSLQLTVSNRFPLKYYVSQDGGEKSVAYGEILSAGDGDEICFVRGQSHSFPQITKHR